MREEGEDKKARYSGKRVGEKWKPEQTVSMSVQWHEVTEER